MADLLYVAVIFGFFALAALFVVACDHLIGPDDVVPEDVPDLELASR